MIIEETKSFSSTLSFPPVPYLSVVVVLFLPIPIACRPISPVSLFLSSWPLRVFVAKVEEEPDLHRRARFPRTRCHLPLHATVDLTDRTSSISTVIPSVAHIVNHPSRLLNMLATLPFSTASHAPAANAICQPPLSKLGHRFPCIPTYQPLRR